MASPFSSLQRTRPCTPYEVFRFGWILYIHIKGESTMWQSISETTADIAFVCNVVRHVACHPSSLQQINKLLLGKYPKSCQHLTNLSLLMLYLLSWPVGQYPQINDDLVNSHHLLLCCVDMLYCSALMGRRKDLLNPDCPFLPKEFTSVDFSPPTEMPCILAELCGKYNGQSPVVPVTCIWPLSLSAWVSWGDV